MRTRITIFAGIILILVFFYVFIASGCSQQEIKTEVDPDLVSYGLADMVPGDEIFTDLEAQIMDSDTGKSYQFLMNNATQDQFDIYVDACRETEFTQPVTEIDTYYQAYTPDGNYSLTISYFPGIEGDPTSNKYIYVDVRYKGE